MHVLMCVHVHLCVCVCVHSSVMTKIVSLLTVTYEASNTYLLSE